MTSSKLQPHFLKSYEKSIPKKPGHSSSFKGAANSSVVMTSKYSLDNSLSVQKEKGAVREPSFDEEKSFSFQLDSSRNTSIVSKGVHNQLSESLINYTRPNEDFNISIHSSPSVKDIEATPTKNSDMDTPSP